MAKDEHPESRAPDGAGRREPPRSAVSAERGRLKEPARTASALAQKRGRLKHAIGRFGAFVRRFRRGAG